MLTYPEIDPVIISIFGLKIRWYGMMYVLGFLAGWWLARRRSRQPWSTITPQQVDDLVFYVMLGGPTLRKTRSISSRSGRVACRSTAAWPAC
jgi:prolipoprotein diacylglyceryltransferase